MNNVLFTLILSVLIGLPATASADWAVSLTPTSPRISGSNGGMVTFTTAEPMQNPAGCGATDFYGIPPNKSPNAALAILLSSVLLDRKISFYIDDTACFIGRPVVMDVKMGD